MVETLPPGTVAETRGMPAGSGFNGLRGFVICHDVSTGRYLFEDDAGSIMMSLRARNLTVLDDDEFDREEHDHGNPIGKREKEKGSDREDRVVDGSGSCPGPGNDESNVRRARLYTNDIVAYDRYSSGETRRAIVTEVDYVGSQPSYTIRLLESGVQKITSGAALSLVHAAPVVERTRSWPLRVLLKACERIMGWVTPTTLYTLCLVLACRQHIYGTPY